MLIAAYFGPMDGNGEESEESFLLTVYKSQIFPTD